MKDAETDLDEFEATPSIRIPETTAMEVFSIWEKLRLPFNAILAAAVVTITITLGFGPHVWLFFWCDALLANACFSVGSVAEGYLCWFGLRREMARRLVFYGGCLVALMLTVHRTEVVLKHLDK